MQTFFVRDLLSAFYGEFLVCLGMTEPEIKVLLGRASMSTKLVNTFFSVVLVSLFAACGGGGGGSTDTGTSEVSQQIPPVIKIDRQNLNYRIPSPGDEMRWDSTYFDGVSSISGDVTSITYSGWDLSNWGSDFSRISVETSYPDGKLLEEEKVFQHLEGSDGDLASRVWMLQDDLGTLSHDISDEVCHKETVIGYVQCRGRTDYPPISLGSSYTEDWTRVRSGAVLIDVETVTYDDTEFGRTTHSLGSSTVEIDTNFGRVETIVYVRATISTRYAREGYVLEQEQSSTIWIHPSIGIIKAEWEGTADAGYGLVSYNGTRLLEEVNFSLPPAS